jgi:hypothetical protein
MREAEVPPSAVVLDYGRDSTTFAVLCPVEQLPLARLGRSRVLAEWWQSARGVRRAPSRSDFNPTDFPALMPELILWDVGAQFVCRLAGTMVCGVAGRELRGLTVDEMHHGNSRVRQEFEAVAQDCLASFIERNMSWVAKAWRQYRRLLLPLSSDGQRVDMLIGHFEFDRMDAAR